MKEYSYPTAFSGWGVEEQRAIDRVIHSGNFTYGSEVLACEEEFAQYHGMRHGIMVNSGSSANLLAVAALFHRKDRPLKPGDKAVVPALAWATSYAPLIQHGVDLLLADADDTLNADPEFLPAVAYDSVRLIVVASILGTPAYLARWRDIANAHDAYVIEDNCESVGARCDGFGLCGTSGIGNTFSFYWSHQMSAIEGGMLLTDDAEYARTCRLLRSHGWSRGLDPTPTLSDEIKFVLPGYNVRPLELHAAIAREQLKKLDARKKARVKNYAYWLKHSSSLRLDVPTLRGDPSPFGIPFLVQDAPTREKAAKALRAAGIDCRPLAGGSLRKQPMGARWKEQRTPYADMVHDTGLMIGLAPFPIEDKIQHAIDVLKEVL